MADYDTYTVFGAVYADRDAAEADFEAEPSSTGRLGKPTTMPLPPPM